MGDITIFLCYPWDLYIRQLERECGEQERTLDLDADLEHEYQLGRAWLLGESEVPWPWYADRPHEVEKPERLPALGRSPF